MTARETPTVCWVTALQKSTPPGEDPNHAADRLVEQVKAAALAGVSLVQIREPALEPAALHRLVVRCVGAVNGTPCRVVVNDRSDVVLSAGAHGVHLREDSMAPEAIRQILPPPFLVGRSVHSVADAGRLARTGAVDYLIFGTVFPSPSKPAEHPAAGVAALREAVVAAAPVPVLAIGGITIQNAAEIAGTGAAGVAGMGLFLESPDAASLRETLSRVRRAFQQAHVMTTQ
jgi:thiamine-phosphate pyrophosphorylase